MNVDVKINVKNLKIWNMEIGGNMFLLIEPSVNLAEAVLGCLMASAFAWLIFRNEKRNKEGRYKSYDTK